MNNIYNKPKMVKQWWLLFHDTKPELNFISAIARTELLNHVQQHVVSIEDYHALESALESANAENAKLRAALEKAKRIAQFSNDNTIYRFIDEALEKLK